MTKKTLWVRLAASVFILAITMGCGGGSSPIIAENLQITDEVVGMGTPAAAGDSLTVKYIGFLTNGRVFDSSAMHGSADFTFTFTLGVGQVIKGWDEGIVGMKKGGRRQLVIPADLAYGDQAVGKIIPANSTLIYVIDLLKVEKPIEQITCPDGNPCIGQANAPVTIALWSDFQCPFCRAVEVGGISQFTTPPALPDIIKNYVDTGKVKIVFVDFPFLGSDSITAAIYNQSIWKLYPEKYFEWRTAMFTAQDQGGDQGFGDAESIDKLNATISGIDAAKVTADVKANASAYQAKIESNEAEAAKAGINGVPSFVIGTQVIAGAHPFANFQSVIDALLK